jgi:hypothetical protein
MSAFMAFVPLAGLAIAATAAIGPSAPPAEPGARNPFATASSPPAERCRNPRTQHAARPERNLRPQRLDELPAGNLELTVLRQVDGCAEPAILREGLGGR